MTRAEAMKLKLWKMAVENVEQNWDMENDRPKESQEQQCNQESSQEEEQEQQGKK